MLLGCSGISAGGLWGPVGVPNRTSRGGWGREVLLGSPQEQPGNGFGRLLQLYSKTYECRYPENDEGRIKQDESSDESRDPLNIESRGDPKTAKVEIRKTTIVEILKTTKVDIQTNDERIDP